MIKGVVIASLMIEFDHDSILVSREACFGKKEKKAISSYLWALKADKIPTAKHHGLLRQAISHHAFKFKPEPPAA